MRRKAVKILGAWEADVRPGYTFPVESIYSLRFSPRIETSRAKPESISSAYITYKHILFDIPSTLVYTP